MHIEACDAAAHVRIGWLRSVCNVFHAFAASSFADELAHLAGRDPKDFLLELIGPDRHVIPAESGAEYENYGQDLGEHPIDTARLKAVLEEAAGMANWGRQLPQGRGLGIAVHRSFLGYVATAAEVTVSDAGELTVDELWTVVDAGTVVNPDRVRSQMEGAGIFGMSLALHGEITARGGAIREKNFDSYQVVRMNEAPRAINVRVMPSTARPGGVGEPGVPPVAPAICNAIFAATGKRVRELPISNVKLA
jgi:isoquinoline 1-oxidoreductase beta subunit